MFRRQSGVYARQTKVIQMHTKDTQDTLFVTREREGAAYCSERETREGRPPSPPKLASRLGPR